MKRLTMRAASSPEMPTQFPHITIESPETKKAISRRGKISACTECGETFLKKKFLTKHFRNNHAKIKMNMIQSEGIKIHKSDEVIPETSKQLPHMNNESPTTNISQSGPKISVCTECGKMYPRRGSLMKHIRNTHVGIKNVNCHLCEYVTHDKSNLDKHIEGRHPSYTDHTCHLCGFSVFREINIRRHYMSVHGLIRVKKMNKDSEGKKCLEINYESLADQKKGLTCYQCSLVFSDYTEFNYHMESDHELKREKTIVIQCNSDQFPIVN